MSKTQIYRTQEMNITKLNKDNKHKESDIHEYFEKHLKTLIGAEIIGGEYNIVKGRVDTLAIDDDYRPVIIEYKRDKVGSAILQALFYKHWLINNRRTFELEVKDKFGEDVSSNIVWNKARVIIVAQKFDDWSISSTEFLSDVELFEYAFYDNKKLLKLKYINERKNYDNYSNIEKWQTHKGIIIDSKTNEEANYEFSKYVISKSGKREITNLGRYENMSDELKKIFTELKNYVFSLDSNIELFKSKNHWSFKNERKFVEIIFRKSEIDVQLFLKNKPSDEIKYDWKGEKGHWGTLHHQFKISKSKELDTIKKYINLSFENVQNL